MHPMIAFSEVTTEGTGGPHTSVPSKMGLFMNAHTAKCVRSSWTVKLPLPLPISIISMSLCAKKSTKDRCSTFVLMIDFMYCQVGLTSAQGHHRVSQSLATIPHTSNPLARARSDPIFVRLSMAHKRRTGRSHTTRAPQVQTRASPQIQRLYCIGGSLLAMAALTWKTGQLSRETELGC